MTFSPAYLSKAALANVRGNYFIFIEGIGTFFAKKDVGTGAVTAGFGLQPFGTTSFGGIDTLEALTVINRNGLSWNAPRIQLDSTRISVGTISVKMNELNDQVLALLASVDLYLKTITLFVGFEGLSQNDYQNVAEYRITEVNFGDERFEIKAEDNLGKLREPITITSSVLAVDLDAGVTTITLLDGSAFPSSGRARISESEVIDWASKSGPDVLTAVTRGVDGSDDDDHKAGAAFFKVETVIDNPINILLQLVISPGGGGPFDVLSFGLGRSETEFNVSRFTTIRDDSALAADTYKFEFAEDIPNALEFFEKEILQFTTTRLFVDDESLLSLALLDEVIIDDLGDILVREDMPVIPKPTSDARKLRNRIFTKHDFSLGRDEFIQDQTHNDLESQGKFGVRIGKRFSSKGIKQSLAGQTIIDRFTRRLLRRIAVPIHRLKGVQALFNRQFFVPGQKVRIQNDKIIDFPKKQKGFDRPVEILSKKWDLDRARVIYEVNASEDLGRRYGYISAASDIVSAVSASVFDVPLGEGVKWEIGNEIALWLKAAGVGSLSTSTITDVTGDTITVSPAFSLTPLVTHRIIYDDYDNIVEPADDQLFFGYISDASGVFPDGREEYVISD